MTDEGQRIPFNFAEYDETNKEPRRRFEWPARRYRVYEEEDPIALERAENKRQRRRDRNLRQRASQE